MEIEEFKYNYLVLKNQLFRYAKRMLNHREEAEEVVQETFIKLWQKHDELDNVSNPLAFAMKATKNLCIDKMRSTHYIHKKITIDDVDYEFVENSHNPEKILELNNINQLLDKIINNLPPQMREVIQLRDIEGLSSREVAQILDINENNVKTILSRVRKKIREILVKQYDYSYENAK